MDRTAVVAISLAVAMACLAGSLLIFAPIDQTGSESYPITYDLDGGTKTGDMPSSYKTGQELTIPEPTKENYVFRGWYTDAELTTPFNGVEELTGAIKLYAAWTDDLAGFAIKFEKDGYYERGINSYTISGSLTCTYLYYDEDKGSYYIRNEDESTYNYQYIEQTYTETDTSLYWSSEVERQAMDGGQEVLETVDGDVLCNITIFSYPSGSTETQWVDANGWKTYKIVSEYRSLGYHSVDYHVELNYTGMDIVQIESNSVTVKEGYGITVTGDEDTYKLGSRATLAATTSEGISFGGWYDENMAFITSDPVYTFTVVGDMTFYALNANTSDVVLESDELVDLNKEFKVDAESYTIINKDTGEVQYSDGGSYTFRDGGVYALSTERTDGGYSYFIVKVTGDVEKTFSWNYNNKTYTLKLDIDYDEYLYAKGYYPASDRITDGTTSHSRDKSFVELSYTDPTMSKYMDELVDKLIAEFKTYNSKITESSILNFLLKFAQYIEYQSDEEYMGTSEYWKFPLETLFDQGGDCEDTSILFCALAHQCRSKLALNYDTAVLLLPGHMAGAIKLDSKTTWSYCETTSTGYTLGEIPSSMKNYVKDSRYYTVIEVD